jgi:hypothetical protein
MVSRRTKGALREPLGTPAAARILFRPGASGFVFFAFFLRAFFLERFLGLLLGVFFYIACFRHCEILLLHLVDGSWLAPPEADGLSAIDFSSASGGASRSHKQMNELRYGLGWRWAPCTAIYKVYQKNMKMKTQL